MAQKFLSLDEAAQTLGISKEKLNQLREDNRIHAYRDGVGWKFKVEEVERVAQEMRDGTFDQDALDLDLLGDENDSILLSEVELGDSENAPSTIIGKQDDVLSGSDASSTAAGDSDLKLASDSDLSLAGESGLSLDGGSGLSLPDDSELTLAGHSDQPAAEAPAEESDLTLASGDSGLALVDDQPQAGPSESNVLASGADASAGDLGDTKGSGIGSHFDDLDELELDLESASSNDLPKTEPTASAENTEEKGADLADLSGISIDVGGSGLSLAGEDEDLTLANEQSGLELDEGSAISLDSGSSGLTLGGSDLLVTGDSTKGKTDSLMSDVALAPDESSIELSADDEDDDELVLGDAVGSDITLGSGDSGINLAPSDSGLSLDEAPLELGGSAVESLDLSEDEVLLEEDTEAEAATQLKTDEDFLLTPLDDAAGDGEDDSSQVIALDSESFDESAATMLGGEMLGGDMEDGDVGLAAAAPAGVATTEAAFAGSAAATAAPSEPETPYTVWNILSLTLCAMLLTLTGMMLFDLVRSMWSWNEPYAFNSTLMDGLTQAIPIFK